MGCSCVSASPQRLGSKRGQPPQDERGLTAFPNGGLRHGRAGRWPVTGPAGCTVQPPHLLGGLVTQPLRDRARERSVPVVAAALPGRRKQRLGLGLFVTRSAGPRPVTPWLCPAEPASSGCGHISILASAHGPTAAPGTPAAPLSIARSASGCGTVRLPTATPHGDSALPGRAAPPRDIPRHGRGRRPQRLGCSFVVGARLPGVPSVRDPGPRIRSDPLRLLRA